MPTNVTYEYENAEKRFHKASTIEDKLNALKEMLSTSPSHKGAEKLRADIKRRISKYKELIRKQKKQKKGVRLGIKKEGAAQVVIVGKTNSGKSSLLKRLTNANVEVEQYKFTTIKPEVGIMDYYGIKIQLIEIPAIIKDFVKREKGPKFLSIIRNANLIVLLYRKEEDLGFLLEEMNKAKVNVKQIRIFNSQQFDILKEDINKIKKKIWKNLNLIYVFTKTPGKKKDFPPVAMKRGSTVGHLAEVVHKDFIKRFKFARIWGESARFDGQRVSYKHVLMENDIVEFHIK